MITISLILSVKLSAVNQKTSVQHLHSLKNVIKMNRMEPFNVSVSLSRGLIIYSPSLPNTFTLTFTPPGGSC